MNSGNTILIHKVGDRGKGKKKKKTKRKKKKEEENRAVTLTTDLV